MTDIPNLTPETLREEADVADRMQMARMRDSLNAHAHAWRADRKGMLFLCIHRVQELWEQGYNEVEDLRAFMPDVREDIIREALYDVAKRLAAGEER